MVRWFTVILLTGCMMAQAPAPEPPTTSGSSPQAAAAGEQKPPAESGSATPLNSGSPFDNFPQFSAIMVGSVLVGDTKEAHFYRSGSLLRTQSAEGIGYFITDLKTFDTYGLSMTGCIHDTHPYMRSFPFSAFRKDRRVERVMGGKETVDGHVCQVEDVTISSGGLINPMQLRFWEADDLNGFPIKVALLKGPRAVIRYKDVVVGQQDPTLFIHPNTCKTSLPQPPAKLPMSPKTKTPPAPAPAGSSHK
jgi:hypothetical protein